MFPLVLIEEFCTFPTTRGPHDHKHVRQCHSCKHCKQDRAQAVPLHWHFYYDIQAEKMTGPRSLSGQENVTYIVTGVASAL